MQWPQTAWPDSSMCNISLKLYKAFQCHSQNICLFYSSTHPSQSPLYQSPHNNFPALGCLQIHLQNSYFSFSVSKAGLNSWTSVECRDVSSSVSCSRYDVLNSSFLLSSYTFLYSCGSYVCEDNIKMYFDRKGNGGKEQLKLTENWGKWWTFL